MCLITRSGRISICEKDIICYKILRKSDNCFKSLYFPYTYYLNNIYREKDLEIKKEHNNLYYDDKVYDSYYKSGKRRLNAVSRGFHSALTKNRLKNVYEFDNIYLVKCIIPKNSQVVKDNTGLIVSNTIFTTDKFYKLDKIKQI